MARKPRIDVGGLVYHVINRSVASFQIFNSENDYRNFELIVRDTVKKTGMRILAYCIMPTHFHFVLYPEKDKQLKDFAGKITQIHTQHWHLAHDSIGSGHIYQSRYKSFIVDTDSYFNTLVRYVEQNPLKAGLVKRAEDWKWGSLHKRTYGTEEERSILCDWPIKEPDDYIMQVNTIIKKKDEDLIEDSIKKELSLGSLKWKMAVANKLSTRGFDFI